MSPIRCRLVMSRGEVSIMKTKLTLLPLLTLLIVAAPNLGRAYAAAFTAYDVKSCLFVSFEPTPQEPAVVTTITGYTQAVQGKGNATEFTGRMTMSDDEWSFFAEPRFLLAGATFRSVARGIMECATGCSAHGVQYVF